MALHVYTFNRDLSWLAFNERVLEEAQNPNNPLLERVRFLSISARNLDEFFMVRVAHLKSHLENAIRHEEISLGDGLSPKERLDQVINRSYALMKLQENCWISLQDELKKNNVLVLKLEELTASDRKALHDIFHKDIFPVLTPMAIDPSHPFPHLPNLGNVIVLELEEITTKQRRMELVPLPSPLPRFIKIMKKGNKVCLLEDVLKLFWDDFFEGFTVKEQGQFRLIRDSELEIHEEEQEDLATFFETAIKERKRGELVQLAVQSETPHSLLNFIMRHLRVHEEHVIKTNGLLGLADLAELTKLERPNLMFPPYKARFPERIEEFSGDIFAAIREKDMLLQHPYETFDVVCQFLQQAAVDPHVIAIKQTLYRTSHNSPIVKALKDAAENGKSVTALVELKARFDEEANLKYARHLESAGVQTVYGMMGLKTHAKISLVIRKEEQGIVRYMHFGTGNYHPENAQVYSDVSLFTCNPELGEDISHIFNYMTGYAVPRKLHKVSIAPLNLRKNILKLIHEEERHAQENRPAWIIAKMNSLVDPQIIKALYRASQNGVKIDLIVRGICTLCPGIPGLSDNITVKSIVGRFLEHARLLCFANGHTFPSKHAKVFISSADWMTRNFDYRIETLVPIENGTAHQQIMEQILMANLHDTSHSWSLNPDGTYTRLGESNKGFSAHEHFMTNPSFSGRGRSIKKLSPKKITYSELN